MITPMHRLVRVVAALLACVGAATVMVPTTATAATRTVSNRWLKYSFSGTGSGVLDIKGSMRIVPGSFFALVAVDRTDRRSPVTLFPDVLDLDGYGSAHTYGTGGHHDICAGPVVCRVQSGRFTFGLTFSMDGDSRHPHSMDQYIALRGADITIHKVALVGWRAHGRTGGWVRKTSDDATGVGVAALGAEAGVNAGTSAPGFARGSVAIAVPACDVVGAGTLVLQGGANNDIAVCPTGPVADAANGRTRWTATGAVAGVSSNSTRLLVLQS